MRSFGLVVPLYDEEERFPEFAPILLSFTGDQPPGSELVFVDDGSGDGTADLAERFVADHPGQPVRLIRRPHEGKGAAVAAGLLASTADDRGFCDLDLSTPLDQFERIVNAARRAPILAIGSRDLATSRVLRSESRLREALGRSYNRLLQLTVTPGVVDTQCGAKVAAAPIWEDVLPHCHELGFAWDAEVIAVAAARGIGVQEIPIDWRHDERSKVNVGRDGLAMVWAVPRIWRRARAAARAGRPVGPAGGRWWARSKGALVSTVIRRTSREAPGRWLVDVGAGSGEVSAQLGWRPDRVLAIEDDLLLASRARQAHGLTTLGGRAEALPVASSTAAVVCVIDVIEHLDDPVAALREAARALAPGGRVVVHVPARRWPRGRATAPTGHRRYTRHLLRQQLTAAGLRPVVLTHAFSWLVLSERGRARVGGSRGPGARPSVAVDRAAMILTRIERALVGRVPLPLGASILCVAVPVDPVDGRGSRG